MSPARAVNDPGIRGIPSTGKSDSPVIQIIKTFPFQSYFDDTLLANAILPQAQGQQIVQSTLQTVSVAGYAIGLHPSSQAPVAVTFLKGAQSGDSGTLTIKPGQIVRPNGEQRDSDGRFSGFQFGLPHGWLGGGNVTIVVYRTLDAKLDWIDRSELIFHRQRALILAPGDVPAAAAIQPNWPIAFPWNKAKQGTALIPQGGRPILSVKPTRIAMSLRSDLASAATMRMYFVGSTEFSQDDTGAEDTSVPPVAYDVTWGSWTSLASANYAAQYQFQFLPVEAFRMSSINGSMILVDASAGGDLAGKYVDIIRYGEL